VEEVEAAEVLVEAGPVPAVVVGSPLLVGPTADVVVL
jgi:hypothetical protein